MPWTKRWSLCAYAASAINPPTKSCFDQQFCRLCAALLVLLSAGITDHTYAAKNSTNPSQLRHYHYRIVNKIPHNRANFTQGLTFHKGYLFESIGQFGESKVLKYRFPKMQLVAQHSLQASYFGEGLDILGDKVFQLSWKSHTGFVYAADDLRPLRTFNYQGEGWGLCTDGKQLFMSNGSAYLTVFHPDDFQVVRQIQVTENGRPVTRLNELEWVNGKIFANVWQQNRLLIIEPVSGKVTGSVDLSQLLSAGERDRYTDVLNGIAFNTHDNSLWVTGKRWPWLFQIELVEVFSEQN